MSNVREQITEEQLKRYEECCKQIEKNKKSSIVKTIVFTILMVIGGCGGFFGALYLDNNNIKISTSAIFFVVVTFATVLLFYYLHIIIHEGGHLIFGLITGYGFLSFRIGSLTVVKDEGRLKFKKMSVPGTAGQCLMTPPAWDSTKPYPYLLYNLGGGLNNLISTVLVLPLYLLENKYVSILVTVFVFWGLLMALLNLVPLEIGVPNDGHNILNCTKDKRNQKAFYDQLQLNAELTRGTMYEEINPELFELGDTTEITNCLTGAVRLFEYVYRTARGESERARWCMESLQKNIKNIPSAFAAVINLEKMGEMILQHAPVEEIAAYYKNGALILRVNKTDMELKRLEYFVSLMSAEDQEKMEWLSKSQKGTLPKKLPKFQPRDPQKIYAQMEEMSKCAVVVGEAKTMMRIAERVRQEWNETSAEPGEK